MARRQSGLFEKVARSARVVAGRREDQDAQLVPSPAADHAPALEAVADGSTLSILATRRG